MRRSIRCRHGFDRDMVPCELCGDIDPLSRADARHVDGQRRKRQARAQVISRPHGRPSNRDRGVEG